MAEHLPQFQKQRLVIRGVGFLIDLKPPGARGNIRGDQEKVPAMGALRPLFAVEDAAGWIVRPVAMQCAPGVFQRRRAIGEGRDEANGPTLIDSDQFLAAAMLIDCYFTQSLG